MSDQPIIQPRTRRVIQADGTTTALPEQLTRAKLHEIFGGATTTVTSLKHLGHPLMVMIGLDKTYEVEAIADDQLHDGFSHVELRPTKALFPENRLATELYEANRPGTTHKILGPVVVAPDSDFASPA